MPLGIQVLNRGIVFIDLAVAQVPAWAWCSPIGSGSSRRIATAYALAALSYALGLALSLVFDLPTGPMIVCAMTVIGLIAFLALPMASSLLSRD